MNKKILLLLMIPLLGFSYTLNFASIKKDRNGGKTRYMKLFSEIYENISRNKLKIEDRKKTDSLIEYLNKKKNIIAIRDDVFQSYIRDNDKILDKKDYKYFATLGYECDFFVIKKGVPFKNIKKKIRVGTKSSSSRKLFDYLTENTETFEHLKDKGSFFDYKSSAERIASDKIGGFIFSAVPFKENNNKILTEVLKSSRNTQKTKFYNFNNIKYKEDAPYHYKIKRAPVTFDFKGKVMYSVPTICVPLKIYGKKDFFREDEIKEFLKASKQMKEKYGF